MAFWTKKNHSYNGKKSCNNLGLTGVTIYYVNSMKRGINNNILTRTYSSVHNFTNVMCKEDYKTTVANSPF